jgi:CheY-like chemotaxis protein
MIVDDSPTVRQQLDMTFSDAGYDVLACVDGQDALERLRIDRAFDLLVTDINMPRLNGADMLEAAHAEGLTAGMPIVVLTTEGHADLVARAMAAGARGWMMPKRCPLLTHCQLALSARRRGCAVGDDGDSRTRSALARRRWRSGRTPGGAGRLGPVGLTSGARRDCGWTRRCGRETGSGSCFL